MPQEVQGLRDILLLIFFLLCTSCSLYYLNSELFPHREVGSCYKDDAILTSMEISFNALWRKGKKESVSSMFLHIYKVVIVCFIAS